MERLVENLAEGIVFGADGDDGIDEGIVLRLARDVGENVVGQLLDQFFLRALGLMECNEPDRTLMETSVGILSDDIV